MLKAILFDLDGTLVNTDPIHFLTWQEVLKQSGLQIDLSFYKKNISGRHNPEIVKDMFPDLPVEEGMKIADAKEALFRNCGEQLQPLAGLMTLLDWLKSSELKSALVSNAPQANANFVLETLAISTNFSTIVLAEDAPPGKPDPAPYQVALQRLGIEPSEAIAFEDSPSGIKSAVGAGIYTVAIATTHLEENLLKAGAKMVIDDFSDPQLWALLKKG